MTPTLIPEPLLTVAEVAAWLNTRPRHIYELAQRGVIPSVKVGRYRRFRRAEIEAVLERQRCSREVGHGRS